MILTFNKPIYNLDSKTVELTASINDASYYANCVIESVSLLYSADYKDRFSINTEKAFGKLEFTDGEYTKSNIFITTSGDSKHITVELSFELLKDIKKIPIVYVECSGMITPDCPCGNDYLVDCMPLINWEFVYKRGLLMLDIPNCNCDIPQNFIDYIISYNGLKLLLKTGRYTELFYLYNKLFIPSSGITAQHCGCHA